MTIYEIKQRLGNSTPYFDRATLKFFGQKLRDFRVKQIVANKYHFFAPSYWQGKLVGISQQVYNASINELEAVPIGYELSVRQYKDGIKPDIRLSQQIKGGKMRNYLTRKELARFVEDDGHYYHVKIDSSSIVTGVPCGESSRYCKATNTGGRRLLGMDTELLRALVEDGQVSWEYARTYRYK